VALLMPPFMTRNMSESFIERSCQVIGVIVACCAPLDRHGGIKKGRFVEKEKNQTSYFR